MIESSKGLHPWRSDVRSRLLTADGEPVARFTGAVAVHLTFVMPRPASAPKKRTPPAIRRPDLDKLERAVLDAITSARVWDDDSQVIDLHGIKRIAELNETAGCWITITSTDAPTMPVDLDKGVAETASLFGMGES
jgi:crossover junction endodeoxyribonuclease RusA